MFVKRTNYNKVITVKLVIPGGCNAHCSFCYNKDKHPTKDKQQFLNNFIISLDDIITRIENKNSISVDITGGEPTLDPEFLIQILCKLKDYDIKAKVLRTTLTTNGINLAKVVPYLKGVIDYVNISIHDYRLTERTKILGFALDDSEYNSVINELSNIGITCSATAVIYKEIQNFVRWRDAFIDWAKMVGFISVRFRCNVFWDHPEKFDEYLKTSKNDPQFQVITYENTTDSHWCRLRRADKMRVFFLHGVLDTSVLTKGIEYVIDDDGYCYCDYYKKVTIKDYKYEIGEIYDSETQIKS